MLKSQLLVQQICLPSIKSKVQKSKKLEQSVRLTTFQNPQLKFVFPLCPPMSFLYSTCYLYLLFMFRLVYFYVSLNLEAVPTD